MVGGEKMEKNVVCQWRRAGSLHRGPSPVVRWSENSHMCPGTGQLSKPMIGGGSQVSIGVGGGENDQCAMD